MPAHERCGRARSTALEMVFGVWYRSLGKATVTRPRTLTDPVLLFEPGVKHGQFGG